MKVSLMVVALNEEKTLPSLLSNIMAQTYPHDKMEIILVDSLSTDGTVKIMRQFAKRSDFADVILKKNPKKKLCYGWNIGIRASTGDVCMRVDAHAEIPPDFVEKSVDCLKSGEFVCGGQRPNVLFEDSEFGRILLLAESSAFGSSIAGYRRNKERTYAKSIFHGAYRREVFEKVGLFNENLGRTEDNEMNFRIRQAGYRICMDPGIISWQHVRPTLKGMLKQKYGNGYWVALTAGVCPGCLELYHWVPGVFVGSLALGVLLSPVTKAPLLAVAGGYTAANLLMSVLSLRGQKKNRYAPLLPLLFAGIHTAYGVGTLVGLAKMPKWRQSVDMKPLELKPVEA